MTLNRRTFLNVSAAGAAILAAPAILRAQATGLKLTHWLPPMHQVHGEFTRWAEELATKSGGALTLEVFPAGQMGPPPRQYELARTGVADLAYCFTAFSPGRFPVTDLLSLPFLLAGADGATMSTADASWLASSLKDETREEYVGTELLYNVASTAMGYFMKDVLVKSPADLKGKRMRPTSAIAAEQLVAMGASPATVPPTEVADAIGKGVVDGAIFNFEGGRAFQLQQSVTRVSTVPASVGVFSLVANEGVMAGLPADLARLLRDTTGPEAGRRAGALYDTAEAAGREFMIGEGVEVIDIRGDDLTPFREALDPVGEAQKEEARARGIDVDAILAKIEKLKSEV